jgi:hypothetical protein
MHGKWRRIAKALVLREADEQLLSIITTSIIALLSNPNHIHTLKTITTIKLYHNRLDTHCFSTLKRPSDTDIDISIDGMRS